MMTATSSDMTTTLPSHGSDKARMRCKMTCNQETRCMQIDIPRDMGEAEATLAHLRQTAERLFGMGSDQPYVLHYQDAENDSIRFDSARELGEAISAALHSTHRSLKLHIRPIGGELEQDTRKRHKEHHHHHPHHQPHKCRRVRHAMAPEQLESALAELEKRGLGRPKRNARLLQKMKGDVEAVASFLKERDEAAMAKKQARQQRRAAHAQGRADASRQEGYISLQGGMPKEVTSLYLDGNNMLFMTGSLRKFALVRGQRWKAEAMLTSLAKAFAGAHAHTALNNTCTSVALENGARFTVASARPTFATSDDAMVAWAQALPSQQVKTSLFITSDRELKERLVAVGAMVAKPKQWMELAQRTLASKHVSCAQETKAIPVEGGEDKDEMEEQDEAKRTDDDVPLDAFLAEWSAKLVLSSPQPGEEDAVESSSDSSSSSSSD